jgi:hypothetical protein
MPLTKEQASQIDWEALLTRLVALNPPLRKCFQNVPDWRDGSNDHLALALTDVLTCLDFIAQCLNPVKEEPPDATSA